MSKRYKWINGETYCDSDQMYDNETGNKTQPVYVADLLNQQDAKIKELEDMVIDKQNKLYSRLDKIKELQEENQQLKQQLAEKDELLKQKIGKMKSTDVSRMCISCGFMVQTKEIDNQTAIAVLEEMLDNEVYINSKLDFEDGNYVLSKIIRTKIEELRNK